MDTLALSEGQVWKEDDKRFTRYIRIQFVCVGGRRVRIQRCLPDGTVPKGARSTEASADRFGRSGGYLLTRS